jgi:hypothetical protein
MNKIIFKKWSNEFYTIDLNVSENGLKRMINFNMCVIKFFYKN